MFDTVCLLLFLILLSDTVYAFNSLPNGEYSNLFIVAAFSSKSFSGKISLSVKNLYLLTLFFLNHYLHKNKIEP